jgi:hypothetical protein
MPSRLEMRPVFLAFEVEATRQTVATDSVIFYLGGNSARFTEVVVLNKRRSSGNVGLTLITIYNNVNY